VNLMPSSKRILASADRASKGMDVNVASQETAALIQVYVTVMLVVPDEVVCMCANATRVTKEMEDAAPQLVIKSHT